MTSPIEASISPDESTMRLTIDLKAIHYTGNPSCEGCVFLKLTAGCDERMHCTPDARKDKSHVIWVFANSLIERD